MRSACRLLRARLVKESSEFADSNEFHGFISVVLDFDLALVEDFDLRCVQQRAFALFVVAFYLSADIALFTITLTSTLLFSARPAAVVLAAIAIEVPIPVGARILRVGTRQTCTR